MTIKLIWAWWRYTTAENLIIFGSGNRFSPVWHQTITWTNDDLLSFGHLGKQLMRNESKCNDFHYGKCIWKVIYKTVANLFRLRWVSTNIYKNPRQYWLISIWLTYMAILQGHGKFIHIIWWFNQIFHFVWSFINATSLWIWIPLSHLCIIFHWCIACLHAPFFYQPCYSSCGVYGNIIS